MSIRSALGHERENKVLVINPNTTAQMTDALRPLVTGLRFDTHYDFYTAPTGVPSINDEHDAAVSAQHCLPLLRPKLQSYDGFLVCCYSAHPLVAQIRDALAAQGRRASRQVVAGIFEASVAVCLQSLSPNEAFGIISTGKQWEEILGQAVAHLFGSATSAKYAGTETTGLNASELHAAAAQDVAARMKDAAKRLLSRNARALCLGCAGMAGMDQLVREACIEHLGVEEGNRILIVDGVVSGTIFLEGALRLPP